MAKIAFVNLPQYGHVNPTLAIARRLVERGHDVRYVIARNFSSLTSVTGARTVEYESVNLPNIDAAPPFRALERDRPDPFMTFCADEAMRTLTGTLEALTRDVPDVIVHDRCAVAGRILGELLRRPTVQTNVTIPGEELFHVGASSRPPLASPVLERFEAMCRELNVGVPTNVFGPFARCNLVFMPRSFHNTRVGDGDRPRPIPAFDDTFHFVGPCFDEDRHAAPLPDASVVSRHPLVFVTFGTVFANRPRLLQICLAAFANTPWQVVVSVGKSVDLEKIGPVPENVALWRTIPPLDVLAHADVCVNHAGMSTVMECIHSEVPMVVIPPHIMHALVAERVDDLGLGIDLKHFHGAEDSLDSLSPDALRAAVTRVLADPALRANVRAARAELRAVPATARAAELIESML